MEFIEFLNVLDNDILCNESVFIAHGLLQLTPHRLCIDVNECTILEMVSIGLFSTL